MLEELQDTAVAVQAMAQRCEVVTDWMVLIVLELVYECTT
jgi:hypothetical protein